MFKLKLFKKFITTIVTASMCVGFMGQTVNATENTIIKPAMTDEILAESAIVMDIDTGTVLYEKNADVQQHPASITKILTALIALENGKLDEEVTFSQQAVGKNESSASAHIARDVGEKMSLKDCMYAMMLVSANECADAIAEHIGGSIDNFVEMMNKRAKELGCTNSHFVCSNGLTDENHYVSARDMALIAAKAYQNPEFRKIIGTKKYTIKPTNIHPEPTYLLNQHDMYHPYRTSKYLYKYCKGGKTGYTDIAKNTLVTYAEKDGMRLVAVVLKDTVSYSKYKDTTAMFEYGFNNYKHFSADGIINLKSNKKIKKLYKEKNLKDLSLESGYVTLPNNTDTSKISYDIKKAKRLQGSAKVGILTLKNGDEVLGTTNILNKPELKREQARIKAEKEAKAARAKRVKVFKTVFWIIVIVGAAVVVGLYVIQKKNNLKRRRRKRRRRRK